MTGGVISGAIDGLDGERIERVANRLQSLARYMQVSSRGSNVRMSEHDLNRAEVSASIQHMGRTGMPKKMRVDAMFDAGELSRLAKHVTNGTDVERRSGCGGPQFLDTKRGLS